MNEGQREEPRSCWARHGRCPHLPTPGPQLLLTFTSIQEELGTRGWETGEDVQTMSGVTGSVVNDLSFLGASGRFLKKMPRGRRNEGRDFDFNAFSPCEDSTNGIERPPNGTHAEGIAPRASGTTMPAAETQDETMSFRRIPSEHRSRHRDFVATAVRWTSVR